MINLTNIFTVIGVRGIIELYYICTNNIAIF